MKQEIKILLADDHRLFLEGVKSMIDDHGKFKVVAEANDGEDVLVKLKSYYVDVLIIDIQMPKLSGIETTAIVREKYPSIKVLALSMHNEKIFIEKMFYAGASGYLLKNTNKEELISALMTVYSGEKYYSPDIMPYVFSNPTTTVNTSNGIVAPKLTKREIEILTMITKEYNNPEIAEELHLSIQTVNTHRKNLLRKLDAKNTAGLVKYALSINLLG